jgi:hypothetical protein
MIPRDVPLLVPSDLSPGQVTVFTDRESKLLGGTGHRSHVVLKR